MFKKGFKILLLIAVVVILILPILFQKKVSLVCAQDRCFEVELAKTQAQREAGLMYREELDKDKGMLFIFDKEDIYPFWMKNTLIPLDMIWINSNYKVVFISQNVQPCQNFDCPSVVPLIKAKYVLELNAGLCQEIGLKVGDGLEIKVDNF